MTLINNEEHNMMMEQCSEYRVYILMTALSKNVNLSQQHSTEITQQQRLNIVQTSLENTHHPSTTFKPHHSTSFCSFSTSLKINSAHHSTQTSNTEQFRSTTQTSFNKTHHPSTSLNKLHHPSTSLKNSRTCYHQSQHISRNINMCMYIYIYI